MNDSVLFLAFATIFGAAMFLVGWWGRVVREESEVRSELARWSRDYPDDVDAAGA